MKRLDKKYHKKIAALFIILVLSGLVISSHLKGFLDYAEYKVLDLRISLLMHSRPRSQDITLVLLTQDCLEWGQREKGWGWPWPRKAYADFVDYMNLGEAKSVMFDVLFSEPSVYRNSRQDEIIDSALNNLEMAQDAISGGAPRAAFPFFRNLVNNLQDLGAREDDASYAKAMENFGRVVQAIFFSSQWGSVATWPSNLEKPLFKTVNFGSEISQFTIKSEKKEIGAQFPIKEIREASRVLGNVSSQPDSDNTYRHLRLFTVFDGKPVPGLSAAGLMAAGYNESITYDSQKKIMRWGDLNIPVDNEGKTLLRFKGPIYQYPCYFISKVLQSAEDYAAGEKPEVYPEDFAGSYVFFGFYAPGLFDICPSPIDANYPGMGMHVTMLDNMLMDDFIQKVPEWISAIIIAVSVILPVILVLFSGRITITVATLLVSLAGLVFAGFYAYYAGWWIPMAAPIIAVITAYLTSTLYSYATEGKDKRFIKNAFSRILSPKVIDQIIADPSNLKLGGDKRKMTAIFTDIQRFSSISSELQDQYGEDGPKVLVELLNLYLTEMSNIILANGGTIDKYEGDAIIAFFGAPAFMKDHAAAACRSAIQMKKREFELKNQIMIPGGDFYTPLEKLIGNNVIPFERPLFTRLGINTGDMVVGFMGTPAKMDYTIMGNAVNLAARLEGVNKQYNTHGILISEYTREYIGDEFLIRPLSRVTVVGIPIPLRLYELLEIKSDAGEEMVNMVEVWEDAFKAYENKNFDGAKKIFGGILQKDTGDKVAKLYIERCEKYIAVPPPASWDGVDNLTEK